MIFKTFITKDRTLKRNEIQWFGWRRFISQYGNLNMMECRLMPCLCRGSCFELYMFCESCSHNSFHAPFYGVQCKYSYGSHPILYFPIESTLNSPKKMGPWQIMPTPATNDFFQSPWRPWFCKWVTRWASHKTIGNTSYK